MVLYQYVFEEGLEMSLVPEKEATPFASGPKILELGLTGFTGRLIITQQALQQYSLLAADYDNTSGDVAEDADGQSSSSSSVERIARNQPQHLGQETPSIQQQRQTKDSSTKQEQEQQEQEQEQQEQQPQQQQQTKASVSKEVRPVDAIDELASVFVATSATPLQHLPVSVTEASVDSVSASSSSSSSVEVVSVASSVSTRKAAVRAETEETLNQLATAFASSTTLKDTSDYDKIDEGSTRISSSGGSSSSSSQESQSQQSSSQEEELASGSAVRGGDTSGDPLTEFTTAFMALSAPPQKPKEGIDSIDASSASSVVPSMASSSASSSSSSSSSHNNKSEDDDNCNKNLNPLAEYAMVYGELSTTGPSKAERQQNKVQMIDEERSASTSSDYMFSVHSSSISSSGGGVGGGSGEQQESNTAPTDRLADFMAAFGALSAPPEKAPGQGEMIDETSRSSDPPLSHSHDSTSQSDDPLTQFTKVYNEYSEDPGAIPSSQAVSTASRAPKPPRQQTRTAKSTQRAASHNKRRAAAQGNKAKKTTAGKKRAEIMSADRKRTIRGLFPNYPDVSTGSHGTLDPVGAYLHQKCAAPLERTLPPKDLRELLDVFPFAAYCGDDKGRLPLHTLGENSLLVRDPPGRLRATNLARILIQAYPESVKYPDSDGMLPFVALLKQWIDLSYQDLSTAGNQQSRGGITGVLKKPVQIDSGERIIPYDILFPNTELVPYVEWCLHMMSMILDDMVGKGMLREAFATKPWREQMEARRRYVGTILGRLPYLIKAVLFLDGGDGPARQRIAQMSFVRRALLCKESVGGWIQAMVLNRGGPSEIGIDYFQLLSHTTPKDFVGLKRTPDQLDVEAFHKERERVYRAIEKMELIIPSPATSDDREV